MSHLRRHAKPLLLLLIADLLWMGRVIRPISGQAIGAHDMRGLFYPWLEFAHNAVWRGDLPLWDSAHFAGYPFLANPQVAFFYPPTWLTLIFPVNLGITLYLILHLWIAGSGMYLFLVKSREWNVESNSSLAIHNSQVATHKSLPSSSYTALAAALTFMFSGFFMARIYAGHLGFMAVHAWMGWLLLSVGYMLQLPSWRRAVIASIPLSMVVLAGHTTSLIYVGLLWLSYAIFQAAGLRTSWLRLLRQLATAGIVALLVCSIQLLPTAQLILLSARSAESTYEFASRFSLPPIQLLTLIQPLLFGSPTTVGYWGAETFEELVGYVGLLPLLTLPLVLRWRTRRVYFWLSIALFGLLLALGEQGLLHKLLFDFVPPFRLTRAPGRGLFYFTFAMSVLLGELLMQLERDALPVGRWFTGFAAAATLLGAALWLFNWRRLGTLSAGDERNRLVYQLDSSVLPVVLVAIGGLLLWYYLKPYRSPQLIMFLLAFMLVDLGNFGRNLIRQESIMPPPYWYAAADIIGPDSQRVLPWGVNLFDQNHPSQVGLNSVFGYNTLELAANDLLYKQATDPRSPVYDLFAADYVVAPVSLDQFTTQENALRFVGNQSDVWVYRRPNALPLAWLESAESQPNIAHRPQSIGTARIIEQEDGYWQLETSSDVPARLVLSEVDYPGWWGAVDGNSADIQAAYGAFRSVMLPAGTHTVEFRFTPTIYLLGLALSLAGISLVAFSVKSNVPSSK